MHPVEDRVLLVVFVPGLPRPEGSLRHIRMGNHIRTVHASHDDLLMWRSTVASYAADLWGDAPAFDDPVAVQVDFYLPRPKSAPKRQRYPHRKPDLDKLLRAILDSLTGVVLVDDARVVDVTMRKRFAETCPIGASIILTAAVGP